MSKSIKPIGKFKAGYGKKKVGAKKHAIAKRKAHQMSAPGLRG